MNPTRFLIAATALAAAASAQFTLVAPQGYDVLEGNSNNAFPWNRGAASMRVQFLYDSTTFTNQGVTSPIIISGLKYRADATTASWAGGTWPNVVIDMATATSDHASASTTFASNMGPDLTNVLTGPVTVQPGTGNGTGVPGPWHIDIPLTTNFVYDPTTGNDLVIDVQLDGTGWSGTSVQFDNVSGAATSPAPLGSRVYSTTGNTATTGTLGADYCAVCEFTYVPANGLFAGFTSDVTGGSSPLTVNFTDNSYSSDPGGVLAWAWDFDGDSVVDSTLQNPSFVFQNCGSYDVTLTVFDAAHPSSTLTRTAYITTDAVSASFTHALIAPGVVQFTDTSVPTPTSWAWDFDGDNVIDDTTQNPAHFYAAACTGATVTLTASRLCGPADTATASIVITPNTFQLTNAGGNGTTSATWVGNVFDGQVTNPDGVNICALSVRPYNFAGPFNIAFYASSGSYLDTIGANPRYATASEWRLLATGTGNSSNPPLGGAATLDFVSLSNNVYLPKGDYCFAVFLQNPNGTAGIGYTNGPLGPVSDANMTMFVGGQGRSVTSLFGTGGFTPRMWNGEFHYATWSDDGAAGIGFAGTGCANSLGNVPGLTPSGNPTVGSNLTITVDNCPSNNAIMCTGFVNDTSVFGPLPFDGSQFGAPGCFLRVSTDATLFLVGASNQVNWFFNIPNNPAFSGQQFYNQAIVFDPAANALGAVVSDASGMLIGN
ncbi:MAG: PKD domain-containing protein [Planctomycetes bacterium]|nr:PKD domain-containing protein [Planctomycetota bacterium]